MAIGAINTLVEEEYFVDANNNDNIDRDTETWLPVIGIDFFAKSINAAEINFTDNLSPNEIR